MPCDCITKVNGHLAKENTRLVPSFTFPHDGSGSKMTVTLDVEKINPRDRRKLRMLPSFCPFCAEPYERRVRDEQPKAEDPKGLSPQGASPTPL